MSSMDRFSKEVLTVLSTAQKIAEKEHNEEIDTGHLVSAILSLTDSVGYYALSDAGVDRVRFNFLSQPEVARDRKEHFAKITLSEEFKLLIANGVEVSKRLGSVNKLIHIEHLLIALAEMPSSHAMMVLSKLGIPAERVHSRAVMIWKHRSNLKLKEENLPRHPLETRFAVNPTPSPSQSFLEERLIKQGAIYSSAQLGMVSFIVVILSLTVIAVPRMYMSQTIYLISTALLIAAQIFTLVAVLGLMPLVAATSASIVTHDIEQGTYSTLLLTPLARRAIIWSYIRASIFRRRLLFAITVGLIPLLFAATNSLIDISTLTLWSLMHLPLTPLSSNRISLFLIFLIVENIFAACEIGILVALKVRTQVSAVSFAIFISILQIIVVYSAFVIGISLLRASNGGLIELMLVCVMGALVAGLMYLAERWA